LDPAAQGLGGGMVEPTSALPTSHPRATELPAQLALHEATFSGSALHQPLDLAWSLRALTAGSGQQSNPNRFASEVDSLASWTQIFEGDCAWWSLQPCSMSLASDWK